jgi:hypothetical protein
MIGCLILAILDSLEWYLILHHDPHHWRSYSALAKLVDKPIFMQGGFKAYKEARCVMRWLFLTTFAFHAI